MVSFDFIIFILEISIFWHGIFLTWRFHVLFAIISYIYILCMVYISISCISQTWSSSLGRWMTRGRVTTASPSCAAGHGLTVESVGCRVMGEKRRKTMEKSHWNIEIWLVVWNMAFVFHFIYGMSSFPLTNSIIFRGVGLNHQPEMGRRHLEMGWIFPVMFDYPLVN